MKKLIVSVLALLISLPVLSKTQSCNMVVPWAPGGTATLSSQTLQKGNPNILIDYRPGAFAALAIAHMNNNPGVFMLSPLHMFSSNNPVKDVNVEVTRVMYGTDLTVVTNKNLTFEDILSRPVSIGLPNLGTGHHAFLLEMKNRNPQIEIIAMGSDSKALSLIVNKEIDAYITSSPVIKNWIENFPSLNVVIDIPFGKRTARSGVTIDNYLFQAILISKDANREQRQRIDECLDIAVASSEFKKEADKFNLRVINASGSEAVRITNEYFRVMKKNGL